TAPCSKGALAAHRKKLAAFSALGGDCGSQRGPGSVIIFANDLAVSIDERHSPLRFIAAERLRGRVKRRARGGLGRVGFLLSTFHVVHHSMIPLRPPHRGVIAPPLTIIGEASSFGCSNAGGARRLSTPHTTLA